MGLVSRKGPETSFSLNVWSEKRPGDIVHDGLQSVAGCSPWGRKESETTERLSTFVDSNLSISVSFEKSY